MPEQEVKIDPETLKTQTTPLTVEQEEAIAAEAQKEIGLAEETPEAKKKREEEEAVAKKADEEKAQDLAQRRKDAGLADDASEEEIVEAEQRQRAKKAGLAEDANLEDIEKAELTERAKAVGLAEDATLEEIEAKEAEKPEPSEEEKLEKAELEAIEKEAEDYDAEVVKGLVESDKITEDQAKEILAKDKAVIEKFEGIPYKLARGYRELQGRADKAEEQVKQAQGLMQQLQEQRVAEAKIDLPAVKNLIMDGKISDGKGGTLSEGQVIDACKRQYPSQTRDKEDEEVLEFAAEKIRDAYAKSQEGLRAERKVKASTRRDELLSKLPDDAKEFEAEIKAEVGKFSDAQVLNPAFDLSDVIRWAKGGKYDELKAQVDKARQEGYDSGLKKGKEEAKALGERTPGPKTQTKTTKRTSALAREMSTREEKRALEMYDGLQISDQEKFKWYIEQYPEKDSEFKI